jgi:hypothetical protein
VTLGTLAACDHPCQRQIGRELESGAQPDCAHLPRFAAVTTPPPSQMRLPTRRLRQSWQEAEVPPGCSPGRAAAIAIPAAVVGQRRAEFALAAHGIATKSELRCARCGESRTPPLHFGLPAVNPGNRPLWSSVACHLTPRCSGRHPGDLSNVLASGVDHLWLRSADQPGVAAELIVR